MKNLYPFKLSLILLAVFYVAFIIYILRSRTPDYFSSEKGRGVVTGIYAQQITESGTTYVKRRPIIHFSTTTDSVEFIFSDAQYLSTFEPGDEVTVVYQGRDEGQAAVEAFFGYWLTLNELMASLIVTATMISFAYLFSKGKKNASDLRPPARANTGA